MTKKEKKTEKKESESKEQDLIDTLKHVQADFDNYRKQVEKNRAETLFIIKKDILTRLLPSLDMFELALKHTSNHEEFVKGVEMIYAQFKGTLEQDGVKTIEDNKVFDPALHEAVLTEDGEEGKIMEVLQKGYTINDNVLRCARVKVGKEKKTGVKFGKMVYCVGYLKGSQIEFSNKCKEYTGELELKKEGWKDVSKESQPSEYECPECQKEENSK